MSTILLQLTLIENVSQIKQYYITIIININIITYIIVSVNIIIFISDFINLLLM